MCILDFGQDLSLSAEGTLVIHNRPRLYSRIIAYLAFPESLESRNQFLATCGAELLQREFDRLDEVERDFARRDHESKDGTDASRKHLQQGLDFLRLQLLKENLLPFGGGLGPLNIAAFGRPLENSLNAGLWDATLAGYQLLFTAIMAVHHNEDLAGKRGGASLNKAAGLMASLGGKNGWPKSEGRLKEAWRRHKTVAHLVAAAILLGCVIRKSRPTANGVEIGTGFIVEHAEEVLQLTQDFLEFGVTFHVIRSAEKILDGETVWHLPVDLPARPLESVLPRLSDEQLSYLKDVYRAPVPMV